jgi:hypothetical protein
MNLNKKLVAFATTILAILLVSSITLPMVALSHNNAPGNNGTVKIHDGGLEPSPVIKDETHVCTFHVHFFFADSGQQGSWWIEPWSPGGDKKTTVLSGNYLTDKNGEYRTPASPDAYSLPDGHYKLFWEGRNDQNVKHKVFWIKCKAPTPTPTPTTKPSPKPTPSVSPNPTPTLVPNKTPIPTTPPTDTVSDISHSGNDSIVWLLAILGIFVITTVWFNRTYTAKKRKIQK